MQTDNRFFDDLAKLATGAAGALTSARSEIEGTMRAWLERRLSAMDLVTREEFDAVKEMAVNARKENERLNEKITALETLLGKADAASGKASPKTKAKGSSESVAKSTQKTPSSAAKTTRTAKTAPKQ